MLCEPAATARRHGRAVAARVAEAPGTPDGVQRERLAEEIELPATAAVESDIAAGCCGAIARCSASAEKQSRRCSFSHARASATTGNVVGDQGTAGPSRRTGVAVPTQGDTRDDHVAFLTIRHGCANKDSHPFLL